jgi:hypothetical protein
MAEKKTRTRRSKPECPENIEITSSIPVVDEVDVLIAGAGIAGCMAAVTAARNNDRVMLVDQFGYLGGNMGPGVFAGGVVHLALSQPDAMQEGLKGIPGEFVSRCAGYVDGQLGHDKIYDSQVVNYVWLKLMEENNVRLMLNTQVSEALMEGKRVAGLIVSNRSGRKAIRAKVTVDATGEADVAKSAGAPTDEEAGRFHGGVYFAINDVDKQTYLDFMEANADPDPALITWGRDLFTEFEVRMFVRGWYPLLPLLKGAWDKGEYRFIRRIGEHAAITLDHGLFIGPWQDAGTISRRPRIVESMVGLWGRDVGWPAADVHTLLETESRKYIFETAQFLRRNVPGFENSWLMMVSPYLHNRSGRSAICDYLIRNADMEKGAHFDDVVFRAWPTGGSADGAPDGFDYPYRQFLPKNVDGLLMAGRSSLSGETLNRSRYKVMIMGQVAGLAAALAARDNVDPRRLDVAELRHTLYHKYHVPMEQNSSRLEKLGLA